MFPQFETIPEKKIAYLVIRKCGCSSIKHAFSKLRDEQPVQTDRTWIHHKRGFEAYAYELEHPNHWFTFTLVRNPIMRFLSFYSNKILDQNIDLNHTFQSYDRFGLLPNMTVDQVIEILFQEKFETEPHLVSQSDIVDAVGFELNHIGKLENINACFNEIHRKTGVMIQPEHLNRETQKPVLPTVKQFERLASFYRRDLVRFGYPTSYSDWYQLYVAGREAKFEFEPGFTFENEAKLLQHSISQTSDAFEINMQWRVDNRQFRKRVVRIVRKVGEKFELIWHAPPKANLASDDNDSIVGDCLRVPFDKLSPNADLTNVFHELYFAEANTARATLTDYHAHDNMLLMPFGHLNFSARDNHSNKKAA